MAVPNENFTVGEVTIVKQGVTVVKAMRGRNGKWRVVAKADIEIMLPDGRFVIASQGVRVSGRQFGTKQQRPR
jgi:hypothetical protein